MHVLRFDLIHLHGSPRPCRRLGSQNDVGSRSRVSCQKIMRPERNNQIARHSKRVTQLPLSRGALVQASKPASSGAIRDFALQQQVFHSSKKQQSKTHPHHTQEKEKEEGNKGTRRSRLTLRSDVPQRQKRGADQERLGMRASHRLRARRGRGARSSKTGGRLAWGSLPTLVFSRDDDAAPVSVPKAAQQLVLVTSIMEYSSVSGLGRYGRRRAQCRCYV